jgi:hypothetical protein
MLAATVRSPAARAGCGAGPAARLIRRVHFLPRRPGRPARGCRPSRRRSHGPSFRSPRPHDA